ncbi:hypothetical protein VTJ83DRAFT_5374 [Remersonia thermophila]|uniref:Mitochondrial genome maintenance protein MGM101 n=1 Tax=Remersonia thermophila TaxID=72144 RepID=A0ABR4D6V9_9PEZI
MRSRALQALRPARASRIPSASPSAAYLRPSVRAASSSSYTPRARTAPSSSPSSSSSSATASRTTYASSYTRAPPPAPAPRASANTKDPIAPSSAVNGPVDPQAAIPQAATVADVDPALAAQIPTPDGGPGAAPSPAFTAALASSSGVPGGAAPGAAPETIDWSSSFHGLSTTPFSPETAAQLMQPIDPLDIEIKPDGIIYLPEIKYRRILNKAFGPGGWGLAPRGELVVGEKVVTREYALVVHGRFIAQARGECQYFSEETIPTAGEGCKSNALLRCCKDLGIASELWDPRFIREFKRDHCREVWVEHVTTKKRRQIWTRKDSEPGYPYQLVKAGASAAR